MVLTYSLPLNIMECLWMAFDDFSMVRSRYERHDPRSDLSG